jgi:integrase
VKAPKVKHYTDDDPNLLTASELGLVLAELPEPFRSLASLMAWTGLRFAEASALKWADLDTANGLIRIRRTAYRGVIANRTKTGKSRSVPMGEPVAEMLQAHRAQLIRDQHPGIESGWVFPSTEGTPLFTGALSKPLALAARKAGIGKRITPHGLRRTFNNLVRQVEADAIVIRSITGHSTAEMTEHYSHVSADEKRKAQAAVLSLVSSGGTSGGTSGK